MYNKNKPSSIEQLFDDIAPRYDLGNNLNSMGLHHLWNRFLIQKTLLAHSPESYLDLCCGTGAIALNYLKKKNSLPCRAYLIDISEQMLTIAKKNLAKHPLPKHQLEIIKGDALSIPLPNQSVDAVTIAYGVRNVANLNVMFEEILRILKPGGVVGILELTRPKNFILNHLHRVYLHSAVPFLGKMITSNGEAYRYLKESIGSFIEPEKLAATAQESGFQKTDIIPLSGGIATFFLLTKAGAL